MTDDFSTVEIEQRPDCEDVVLYINGTPLPFKSVLVLMHSDGRKEILQINLSASVSDRDSGLHHLLED